MKRIDFDVMADYRELLKVTDRKWNSKRKKTFSNDILTLDIETTSAWYDENTQQVLGYEKGKSADYWNSLIPLSLCYTWQFSFNDLCFFGRELGEFEILLRQLDDSVSYVVYVHNLAWEFQFLRSYLKVKDVFCRQAHKPMKCTFFDFENIEFRCSYILTGLSLDNLGKQIGVEKLHTLNYDILRTPRTKLTEEEIAYCIQDCNVVYETIKKYRKKYGSVSEIPLTKTGETRLLCRKLLNKIPFWNKKVGKMLPNDCSQYRALVQAYAGGYTHANVINSNQLISGDIHCFDFASSYPYVMLSEKFPMGSFYKTTEYKNDIENYAYLMKIKLTDLKSTTFNHYISVSKCLTKSHVAEDNGRIITAKEVTLWVTEIDFEIIKKVYDFNVEFLSIEKATKQYLPKSFIEFILECYGNKTKLKGAKTKEEEELYMSSKGTINSLYGMCVSALIPDDIEFNDLNNDWFKRYKTEEDVNTFLSNCKQGKTQGIFLNYAWGVWISAYARFNLWTCILKHDKDVIYCDTDSIKMIGKGDFDEYNQNVITKLKKMCDYYDINFELTRPEKDGKKYQIGLFMEEDVCYEFKTLGAKKYCCRYVSDNKLHLTVSGINKGAVELLNDDIDNFENGFSFDKDAECVTTKLLKYLDDIPSVVWKKGEYDEYVSHEKHGINLMRRGYKIGITDEYEQLVKTFGKNRGVKWLNKNTIV